VKTDYLVEGRFSATDIIVGYTINWGQEQGILNEFPNLRAYLERLLEREHCTLKPH
jgi:glutathione S-transferase